MSDAKSDRGRIPPGVPVERSSLVSYADGAVVSRIVHKNAAGNVTVFAFDEGEGLSEHTAPFDALVEITDGECDITIGGETHRVRAGQMILMPAGIPHALHASRRFQMTLVMLRGA